MLYMYNVSLIYLKLYNYGVLLYSLTNLIFDEQEQSFITINQ